MADDEDFQQLERQLDELTMLQSVYPDELVLDTSLETMDKLNSVAGPERDESMPYASLGTPRPLVEFSLALNVDVQAAQKVQLSLTVSFGIGYPERDSPEISFRCDKLRRANLAEVKASFAACLEEAAGEEAVMMVVQTLTESVEEQLVKQEEEDRTAQAAIVAANEANSEEREWKRCWFWVNHMLEGRQHKKEAKVVDLAQNRNLVGCLFYGKPGIIVVEGPHCDINEFAREASKAGKSLKIKKTQSLKDGKHDSLYSKFVTAEAVGKNEALDTECLQEHLERANITGKFKHIIGVEQLPSS